MLTDCWPSWSVMLILSECEQANAQLVVSRFMHLKYANVFSVREMISRSAKVLTGRAVGIIPLLDLGSHGFCKCFD